MSATPLGPFDPTIYISLAFFFGVAAQFRAMDGYTFLRRVLASIEPRVGIIYAVSLVTFVFSPFVLNDVLVLILTPAVIKYARQYGLDAAPLIVAEVTFTNISSSLTPIGNPQNILLWASSGISFSGFVAGTWPYVLASAAVASIALVPIARRYGGPRDPSTGLGSLSPAWYLAYVTAVVLALDYAGFPASVPLAFGFLGGFAFNRSNLPQVLVEFDFRSLATLSVFVAATAAGGYLLLPYISSYVAPAARGAQPYSGVFLALVSNVISNVPATQLLIGTAGVQASVVPKIAAEAGLAGNFGPIASFANLLALQMASRAGVSVKRIVFLQVAIGVLAYLPVFV